MGRRPVNRLQITLLPNGSFRLWGEIGTARIRQQSRNRRKLELRQAELEAAAGHQTAADAGTPRRTILSADELREAEVAWDRARKAGISLLRAVEAGAQVMPPLPEIAWPDAVSAWKTALAARHRYARTLEKNEQRVSQFFRAAKVSLVSEVTPAMVEAHILRPGVAPLTQKTDGQVLRLFFRYAEGRWLHRSPFTLNLREIGTKKAEEKKRARILTSEQCADLVQTAASLYEGQLLPYVGLALFCFLRHGEALRTGPEQLRLRGRSPFIEVFARKRGTRSDRTVKVPANALPMLKHGPVVWSKRKWNAVREAAGLSGIWEEHVLRHTGMSYFHQKHRDAKELAFQAGDTPEVAHAHYIRQAQPGAARRFYAIRAAPAVVTFRAVA